MASLASLCFIFLAICMFCLLPRYEAETEVDQTTATTGVMVAGDANAILKVEEFDRNGETVKEELKEGGRLLQPFENVDNTKVNDIEALSLAELQARVDAALADAERQGLRGVSVGALGDVLSGALQGDGNLLNRVGGIKNEEALDPISIVKNLLKLLVPL
eukprot:GHVS01024989.1.p1 GENE.GHVS01024989.1~~GHVS01024989.1.p1  ORF type:complete len:161 (+),score=35.84 GHVS01024989.1:126-608(+)